MIFITDVHLEAGTEHKHITLLKWTNPASNTKGTTAVADMVKWLNDGGVAKVRSGNLEVEVRVFKTEPPHVQTYADGIWRDNLLALPRF